jgi:hypothetical protein
MRYLALVLLNLPIILAALVNIVTQYKLKKVSAGRFRHQLILWIVIMVVLIGSFPLYNMANGKAAFDSEELSLFDIVQTTAIILLFYIVNNQRQRNDQSERRLRELHQELSIKLSDK